MRIVGNRVTGDGRIWNFVGKFWNSRINATPIPSLLSPSAGHRVEERASKLRFVVRWRGGNKAEETCAERATLRFKVARLA